VSERTDSKLNWQVFTEGYRFDDGFLLMQGKQLFNWLPLAALQGEPNVVEALIKANVDEYHDRRSG
jgi:hypothetical protein